MLNNLVTFGTEIPKVEDMVINHTYMLTLTDGVYRYKRTSLMLVKEKIETFQNTLIGLDKGSEGVELLIPKVPFKLWLMSLDFFKDIFQKYGTEAITVIYHIQDMEEYNEFYESLTSKEKSSMLVYRDFLIHAPLQENEPLVTNFGECPLYNKLSDMSNIVKVIELHSHHQMEAYWSETDNQNQNEDCFYGVYGKLGENDDFLMKYVIQGANVNTTVDKLFHFPKLEVTKTYEVNKYDKLIGLDIKPKVKTIPYVGVFPNNSTYPKEWLDMVTGVVSKPVNESRNKNRTQIEQTDLTKVISSLERERMVWVDYRNRYSLKPEQNDLTQYTKDEIVNIVKYLIYTHRILALDFLISYLGNKDSTEIEQAFKNSATILSRTKFYMVSKGYLTMKDENGLLNNIDDLNEQIYHYFRRADALFPSLQVPNLPNIYLVTSSL